MKKTNISLLFVFLMTVVFSLTALSGCKFDVSKSKYLTRPDIEIKDNYIIVRGAYVNSDTEYINIYRQDVTDNDSTDIIRVAILFPKGFDNDNQTFIYFDYNIFYGHKYRYYVRFVEKDGSKNRTEWSEGVQNTNTWTPPLKVAGSCSYAYSIPSDAEYTYDPTTMTLSLPAGKDFTEPDAIDDFSEYAPALVFEAVGKIQTYEIPATTSVPLKALLPQDFLYTDIKLLGIVGQKKTFSTGTDPELQQITWTELAPVIVLNTAGNTIEKFRLEPEFGADGYDYSISSDNEN